MTDGGSSEGRRREVISKREVTGWRPLTLAGATSRLGAPPPRAGRAGGTIRHRSRIYGKSQLSACHAACAPRSVRCRDDHALGYFQCPLALPPYPE